MYVNVTIAEGSERSRAQRGLPMRYQKDIFRVTVLLLSASIAVCFHSDALFCFWGQKETVSTTDVQTKHKAIVDLSASDLRRLYSAELGRISFDLDQSELGTILKRVGENVEALFDNLNSTSSKEQIILQKYRRKGNFDTNTRITATYRYLVLVRPGQDGVGFREERTDSKGNAVDLPTDGRPSTQLPSMAGYAISSGFASHGIFFHPKHQFGSRFRYVGRQTSQPYAYVIAFAQLPKAGDYLGVIRNNERSTETVPVLRQGLAWVDPKTYQIIRIHTDLLEPDQVGMKQTTDISFSEVHFTDNPQVFWLPREVVVSVYRQGAADPEFRNTHTYSDYQLFRVDARIKS
jgi:hypothetical protein